MPGKTYAEITPGAAVLFALGLLVVPLRWLGGLALAAVIHEMSHILSLCIMKVRIHGVRISGAGIYLQVGQMPPLQEGICAAAGPAGSFALLALSRVFPEAAICGLAQGIFNLIPLYPFDGGRILESLLFGCSPGRKTQIIRLCTIVACGIPAALSVGCILLFPRYRIFIIAGTALILGRAMRKIPCKENRLEVQ